MSIVRYVNKKTGRVALYESTSHYDPETKQSRPIRKYLGTEDPETGELIPSTGNPGRKPANKEDKTKSSTSENRLLIENLKKECAEKDRRIKALEQQNAVLRANLDRIRSIVTGIPEE